MNQAAHQAIEKAAGRDNYSSSRAMRILFAEDATNRGAHPPEAVVRGTHETQIARVLKACSEHQVPVVPRGAGSGQTGGAIPVAGGVVLDLAGLDRIISLSRPDQVAVVQPGVVTGQLQKAAAEQGLFYPPDPSSADFCTIGGNVAENAGGLRAVKYGVTRDYVMGVRAITPTGEIFETGGANIKSVVGYDLSKLLVGSEGTLAVFTRLTLRLIPKPEAVATLSGYFKDLTGAARAVQELLSSGIVPTACEFMDRLGLKVVGEYGGVEVPDGAEALILVDIDGPPEVIRRQAGQAAEILSHAGGEPVKVADDAEQAAALWKARKVLSQSSYQLGPNKLNEDVAAPLGRLADLVRMVRGISKRHGLPIVVFGHAGDGNLHVNTMYDASDPEQSTRAHEARSDVFAAALSLGGTLSGEHGVGTTKLGPAGAEIDPVALMLMHRIKKAFDPAGILNPHKALPPL
jgi:glycolate oxidase